MASEETIGTIVQKLALDMKEFETSIQKAEGLSKALKMSMKDLGTLTVDPSGKLLKSLDDVSVKTDAATQSTRGFFREQRLQDRVLRESIQSISSMAFAMAFLAQGFGQAEGTSKRLTSALIAGVGAMNATEFALFGLGKAGEQMGGKLGGALVKIGNMAGPIAAVVAVLTSVVQYVKETEAELARLDESIRQRRARLSGGESLESQLSRAREELKLAKTAHDVAAATTGKRMSWQQAIRSSSIPGADLIADFVGSGQVDLAQAADKYYAAMEKVQDIVSKMYDVRIKKEDELDRLRDMAAKREAERRKKGLSGPPEMYGPDKPSYIDQEYEAELRSYERWQTEHERFWQTQDREREQAEANLSRMREAQWDRDIQSAQNLGNVLLSSFNIAGDSLLGKLIRAVQYAAGLANAVSKNDNSVGGVLGVISSFVPFLGLLGTPSTGIGETLDTTMRSPAYAGSPVIRMVGRVDISNGQAFLIQEMPGYEDYMGKKAI